MAALLVTHVPKLKSRTFRLSDESWTCLTRAAAIVTKLEGVRVSRSDVLHRLLAAGPVGVAARAVERRGPCDGSHGGEPCDDPRCWSRCPVCGDAWYLDHGLRPGVCDLQPVERLRYPPVVQGRDWETVIQARCLVAWCFWGVAQFTPFGELVPPEREKEVTG